MNIPEQLIPVKEKNEQWCQDNVRAIMQSVSATNGMSHVQNRMAFNLYNGYQNEADFEYLTGSDEFRLPARVRFYPIARPLFDNLKSSLETRPLEPRVFSVDNGSIDEKRDLMANKITDTYINGVFERHDRLTILQQRTQLLKRRLAPQPGPDGQPQEPDPEAALALQQIELAMARTEREVASGQDILQSSISKLEKEARHSYQTRKEQLITSGLEYLLASQDLKSMFVWGFESLFTMDQEVYHIEEAYEGQDPRVRRCNPLNVYYGSDMESEFLDQVPWVLEERFISASQVIVEYGHDMDVGQVAKLKDSYHVGGLTSFSSDFGNSSFNEMPMGTGDNCGPGVYSGSIAYSGDLVRVCDVAWKSVSKVVARQRKGKYDQDLTFTHLVQDESEVREGEQKIVRYQSDWYEGTCIAGNIYTRLRKCPFQHRNSGNLSEAFGPYIGFAYNGLDRRPYSRVMAVKDLIVLYNLVMYQIELLIALSSIKGVIMDKSQIPAGMSMKEWFYYLKQGIGVIDSTQLGSDGRRPNFNQFQTYDMSFGNAIEQLTRLTERIEYLVGRVVGIPPQRMGEVLQQDQVSTHKQAIASSNLTTETLFFKHNRIVRRVLSRLANMIPHVWKEGKRGAYRLGEMGQKILNIEAGELDDAMCEVFINDGGADERVMDRLTSAVEQQFIQGQATLSQLTAVFSTKNLRELHEVIDNMEKVAVRRAEQQQQSEAQTEQENLQIKSQFDTMLKKQLTDGEALKGKIDQMGLQLEAQRSNAELQAKMMTEKEKVGAQRDIAGQNTMVELESLREQKRSNVAEEGLRRLEIGLDAVDNATKNLSSGRSKNDISDR